ncbi:MAG: hypothetical protein SPL46_07045 [Selenomonadaceae bacterium]|nr:hypothetical protein [Selenomonadaceae bacterium]
MKKKYKLLIIIILLIALSLAIYYIFFNKKKEIDYQEPVIEVTNQIDDYGYTLDDRDTELFKEKFEKLKTLLNEDDYDKEEYIKLVSELFIIDFYTIDNKISKYDVGGLEYVYSDAVESLKGMAINTIYKTVENNLDKTRKQELPEVSDIEVNDISKYEYILPDEDENDYKDAEKANGYREV